MRLLLQVPGRIPTSQPAALLLEEVRVLCLPSHTPALVASQDSRGYLVNGAAWCGQLTKGGPLKASLWAHEDANLGFLSGLYPRNLTLSL